MVEPLPRRTVIGIEAGAAPLTCSSTSPDTDWSIVPSPVRASTTTGSAPLAEACVGARNVRVAATSSARNGPPRSRTRSTSSTERERNRSTSTA